jgi:ribosomal protein S18 acetylase RimI-like enzyme
MKGDIVMFQFVKADINKFAVFHTVYTASNIFDRFDWNERVEDAVDCISDMCVYFVCNNESILGGFTLKENRLNYPFIVVPFNDRKFFWDKVLEYAMQKSRSKEIFLNEIPEADVKVLIKSYGATLRWSKQRMIRPTEQCTPALNDDFYFDSLTEADKKAITDVIYAAHFNGYTSMLWKPNMAEIKTAVERRFVSFGQTNTLYMSNTVKSKDNNKIAGVCIAGIYPDSEAYSTSKFATIHQVSVRPEYRRKGIAKAMMLKSINDASNISPVMTLGVLKDNPAEKLYYEVGFRAGDSYSELLYTVSQ